MIDNKTITIQLSEYKELLIIKGKYEELKNMYMPSYPKTTITYGGGGSITATPYEDYTYTAGYCNLKDFKGDEE